MTDQAIPLTFPTRFRAAEGRSARMGRILRRVARVSEVDEDLMTRIGRGFMECDETGAALARAMRAPAGAPDRVTMAQFRRALTDGIGSVPDAPPALHAFFDVVETVPGWVDFELLEEGARVNRRLGQNAADVLLQLSLIGGYRFGGPTDLLVATGGLTGDMTMRRLGETQKWTVAITTAGSMRRDGEGFALTVHVRLMHALVNESFAGRWDEGRWGIPINQTDQASTLGLFNGVLLLGSRALGVRVTREESLALMHLWKYVGWLMGVDDDWLVDTERDQHRLNYHLLLAQDNITEAGPQLAQAILDAQKDLHFTHFSRWGRRLARERHLSMLTPFMGWRSMRQLGLPMRLPWATAYVFALNTVRYRVVGRTAWGERYLQHWSAKSRDRVLFRHFGPDHPEVGTLKL